MLELTQRVETGHPVATVTLTLDQRIRARLRVTLDNGNEAGLFLERGIRLRHGDLLLAQTGEIVQVHAAAEPVSVVRSADPHALMRAAYHLGNRHVELEISLTELRYRHDHVLDDMLRGLGLRPGLERLPFEPEPGAYGGGHAHAHEHHHDHGH
ncbi:MAG: urease accessory protein UreE [Chromatiales bacterium]|nr:urease accessory protein UreE [Chromatiales bacterium]